MDIMELIEINAKISKISERIINVIFINIILLFYMTCLLGIRYYSKTSNNNVIITQKIIKQIGDKFDGND